MKKLDLRLLRFIQNSKGQFLSITVVITVALAIFVAFSMTAVNMENTVEYYYEITNFADIFVQTGKIPKEVLNRLQSIDEIEMVQGRITFDVPLKGEDNQERITVRVVSLTQENNQINQLYLHQGRRITDDLRNGILLKQFADARGIELGDQITPYINGKVYTLEVVGIADSPEYTYVMENEESLFPAPEKFGILFVSEAFAQSAFGYRDSYNEVLIKVKDGVEIDDALELVKERLEGYGVKRVIKREDQLSNRVLMEEIKQLKNMSTAVPILFLFVAAIVICIMLSRVVKNDQMVIGVLKAMGYGNISILFHYMKYVLAMGLIGSVVGNILGILISGWLADLYVMYIHIPFLKLDIYYIYLLYSVILTSIFCVFSGLAGAKSVLSIMPADSMRPEAPKAGGRIFLERSEWIWNRISFSWKMVIRNILRNKRRFIFLLLGIALTYAVTIIPVFMYNAFSSIFEIHYGDFQRADFSIDFTHPMNQRVVKEIQKLISADRIEPKIEFPFELCNENYKRVVNIVGVPKETVFYYFVDNDGRPIPLSSRGILVTEGLAKGLGVKVGDQIEIKNFIPGKKEVEVEVKGIVTQYLGINAYMDIYEMQRILMDQEMVTGVLVASRDSVKEKLNNVKNIASIQSSEDMRNSFMEYLDLVVASVMALMLFGGILGFAIVYNATVISISERRMEFSSLRVMGFEKKEIYRMLTKENLLMTLLGILLGIPISGWMCQWIVEMVTTDFYTIPVILPLRSYIYAAIATIVFVVVAQLATLRKIHRLNFIDALKNRIS